MNRKVSDRRYAYLFTVGGKIAWSNETADRLPNRADNDTDKALIEDFIDANRVGSFIELNTGEFIFQTA